MKSTVAIVGVGLIGGSLGQALRRTGRYRVIGISRKSATIVRAKRLSAIDEGYTELSGVRTADIVVICNPVDLIAPTVAQLVPYLKTGALVTDAGSVKGSILKSIAPLAHAGQVNFVGSHPLAGSHKTGVNAARFDLYHGSTVVVVPLGKSRLKPIEALWKAVGARVVRLSADDHDEAVALISHLPHLIAHALVASVLRRKDRGLLARLMAGSFRDATRVASADPEQWAQIFSANRGAVRQALRDFRRELKALENHLSSSSLSKRLLPTQQYRLSLFRDH